MALGFGFNKTKVLSAAEKFVQQGKLQNAIAEYEKIIKEDPKDLTVLNAIGDLYARVGQNDKACEYFKKVGDHYGQNGFTVKAIAVYKKLTRLSTSSDAAIKLAELYTQQGLFNDARTHYMQVADQMLKTGDNNQAARVFQKILELDPENTTTQSKLADLYIKLGKQEEARNIYYSAAESLYARKAFDAADEALSRVLSVEPEHNKALLLRGMIAAESGDMVAAAQYLEQVPDLDSRPEALRALVKAKLQTGAAAGIENLALKLFTVHQDMGGISALAEWLGGHHREEEALDLYGQYAERFLAQGSSSLVAALYPLISRVRDNPPALERMMQLLQRAGDTSHLNEVMELLAHAKVQSGEFAAARDLYKELSEAEPENPLHTQNYRQMLAKLGEDSVSRTLTAEESSQAVMVEELEHNAPAIHQEYAPTVEKSIEAALTDAELFISYNVPLKAIAPLETVLPMAPRDLRLNQRLASLYVRAGRYADAVHACRVLSEIYAGFGHQADADRYAREAKKYSERAGPQQAAATPLVEPKAEPPTVAEVQAAATEEIGTSTVREVVLDVPEEFFASSQTEAVAAPQQDAAPPQPTVQEFAMESVTEDSSEVAAAPAAAMQPEEIEIDVSHEWESMLAVEQEPAIEPSSQEEILAAPPSAIPEEVAPPPLQPIAAAQEPGSPAHGGFSREEPVVPAAQVVVPPVETAPAAKEVATVPVIRVEPVIPTVQIVVPPAEAPPARKEAVIRPAIPVEPVAPTAQVAVPPVEKLSTVKEKVVATPKKPVGPIAAHVAPLPTPVISPKIPIAAAPTPPATPPTAPPPPVADHAVIEDKVQEIRFYISQGFWDMARAALHDLREMAPHNILLDELRTTISAGEAAATATATAVKIPAAPPPAPPEPPRPIQVHVQEDDFVLELDDEPAPPPKTQPVAIPPPPAPEPAPALRHAENSRALPAQHEQRPVLSEPEQDVLGELVSGLEESLGDFVPSGTPQPQTEREPEPEPVHSPSLGPSTTQAALIRPATHAAAAARSNGGMQNAEAASVLSDILSELQQDLGEDTAETEDPETHYNLGIAFKEMGLLDEAIGELQKVCHAVELGNSFSQPVQAYTWLAQCLVDKGVPEASVRWYQKALQLPGLDQGSRCAIYYDLGSAYEASGDKKSALTNFMEVYSSNIDFRDVATRIKVLKS